MLKVLLVDDEINIVEGLKLSIEWEKHGYEVADVAQNGEDGLTKALELKPDLIITDITMPRMNGLEMAESIRGKLPGTSLIFLTCHEDFHFAKKAVNLEAAEYLIKDTMTREELYACLDKIKRSMDEKRLKKEKTTELTIELNQNRSHFGEILINDLLKKKYTEIRGFKRRLEVYGYQLKKKRYVLSVLTIDRYLELIRTGTFKNDTHLIRIIVLNIVDEILKTKDMGEVFPKSENEYVIVYNFDPNLKYSMHDRIISISKEIQACISKVLANSCTIYIGMQVESLLDIYLAYRDISILKNKRFYLEDGRILSIESKDYPSPKMDGSFINGMLKEFENRLGEMNLELLINRVDSLFEKAFQEKITASDVKGAVERIFLLIINGLEKHGSKYKEVIEENYLEVIDRIDNMFELKEFIKKCIVYAVEMLKKNAAYHSSPEMKKILQYVIQHLEEEISLDTVALYANMNRSYFSRYFKSKTGENFVDFLARTRIEKAKELLRETDYTIDEISLRVGHVNKGYFTKVFKKVTGLNPGEFRKKKYV